MGMQTRDRKGPPQTDSAPAGEADTAPAAVTALAPLIEIGGPPGPEPTRFGDWEKNGRCIDF
jgi:hypothetical protein